MKVAVECHLYLRLSLANGYIRESFAVTSRKTCQDGMRNRNRSTNGSALLNCRKVGSPRIFGVAAVC